MWFERKQTSRVVEQHPGLVGPESEQERGRQVQRGPRFFSLGLTADPRRPCASWFARRAEGPYHPTLPPRCASRAAEVDNAGVAAVHPNESVCTCVLLRPASEAIMRLGWREVTPRIKRAMVAACCLAVLFGVLPQAGRAQGLDVAEWLSRPGVRLLAVEFYATWCSACIKAVPKWKELHKQYRRKGLRFVVVAVRDPEALAKSCKGPGWTPDLMICDLEGTLARAWGVEKADGTMALPAAFLWSWRGNLLVRKGHVAEVEAAIRSELREFPRVSLDPDMDRTVRELVRAELAKMDKVVVVADEKENKRLARIVEQSHSLSSDEELACDLTGRLPANSLAKAVFVGKGEGRRLVLSLLSAEKGCLVASATVRWDDGKPEVSAAEAVSQLIGVLKGPIELPSERGVVIVQETSKLRGRERRIGEEVEEWTPEIVQKVVVTFESEPSGAVVHLDGELLCHATPCSEPVEVGRHAISMEAKRYEKRVETMEINKATKLNWKLAPQFGWLSVTSDPPGAVVKIDGKEVGSTPLRKHEVDPGMHDVLVTSRCHYDSGERVNIEMGKERRVDIKLASRAGGIDVVARDSNGRAVEADVFVDGHKVGRAPGVFKVSVCAKEVEVRRAGEVWKESITVKEKEVVKVEGVLTRQGLIDWVQLEGGRFRMGSNHGPPSEKPVHWVTLDAFEIARTEVTNAQYLECVNAGVCSEPHWDDGRCMDRDFTPLNVLPREFRQWDHPVVCVDWYQALQFSQWVGGRLCTEAEWEYAARSGGLDWKYPWGDESATCERAIIPNSRGPGCGQGRTFPVCSRRKGNTKQGLCDMVGNVFEWVWDWHGDYLSRKVTNPTGPESGSSKVIRGGSWHFLIEMCRASYRSMGWPPEWSWKQLGFRPCRSLK